MSYPEWFGLVAVSFQLKITNSALTVAMPV